MVSFNGTQRFIPTHIYRTDRKIKTRSARFERLESGYQLILSILVGEPKTAKGKKGHQAGGPRKDSQELGENE